MPVSDCSKKAGVVFWGEVEVLKAFLLNLEYDSSYKNMESVEAS